MNNAHTINGSLKYLVRLLVSIALLSSSFAWAAETEKRKIQLGNDEETFVFAGVCPSGEPYRLFSYQRRVGGLTQPYYDYDGPVGKGTVQSETHPKVMAVRVCRPSAEIISANYWETY